MNSIILSGIVVSEPELKNTQNDKTVADVSIEVAGQKPEDPKSIVRCVAWGNQAQKLADSVKKGHAQVIKGRCSIQSVDRPEGFKEKKTEVTIESFSILAAEIGLNCLTLVGRVSRDPEVKYFESGACKSTSGLAVRRSVRDSEPDWFDWEAWDKSAGVAADYVRKGSLIGIEGSLKFETWNDRNSGATRSKPVVKVNRIELLGSKQDTEQNSSYTGYSNSSSYSQPTAPRQEAVAATTVQRSSQVAEVDFDDCPF